MHDMGYKSFGHVNVNNDINALSVKFLQKHNPQNVVAAICDEIVKYTSDFGLFYSSPKYTFAG